MATPTRLTRGGAAQAADDGAADQRQRARAAQARDRATLREVDLDLSDRLLADADGSLASKAQRESITCTHVLVRAPLAASGSSLSLSLSLPVSRRALR
jgi:hypothetical protein